MNIQTDGINILDILWALRKVPNETTGVPPWVMAFGHLPRGSLAILKNVVRRDGIATRFRQRSHGIS